MKRAPSIILFVLIACVPVAVEAQSRAVGVPDVWAPNPDDTPLAAQMTITLRGAVSTVPGWTIGTLAIPLEELMRDCNGMVEGASGVCMAHMAAAHDPSIAHGLVLFAGIMRNDDGVGLTLNLSLHTVADGATIGTLVVPIERTIPVGERNRLAADWMHQLAVQASTPLHVAAPPEVAAAPVDAHPPEPPPVVETAEVPTPAPTSSFDAEFIAWPLIGLAAASAGVVIASAFMVNDIQGNPDFVAYRSSFGAGTGNVCSQPGSSTLDMRGHSLCSDADLWETLELAFGVIGGVALAGGLTALIVDLTGQHPSDEHALLIRPTFGPSQARLDVSLTF